MGSFGPFYGEQIDCGKLWPFLWEQINCGKLALFMVRFKYYMPSGHLHVYKKAEELHLSKETHKFSVMEVVINN